MLKTPPPPSDSLSDYEDQSNSEDYSQYKLDGYHPVYIGESFNNGKYTVIQKLGWGHFSTVWLVHEMKTSNYFALKIQKSKQNYFEAALDELDLLRDLNKNTDAPAWLLSIEEYSKEYKDRFKFYPNETYVIRLLDCFVHIGMHGKHPCSVLELMGPNLLDLIQHFEHNTRRMELWMVKHVIKQVLLGLDYMHRVCNIIHTDLKPENVMIRLEEHKREDFVKNLKEYGKKPLSMKFLKFLKTQLGVGQKKKPLSLAKPIDKLNHDTEESKKIEIKDINPSKKDNAMDKKEGVNDPNPNKITIIKLKEPNNNNKNHEGKFDEKTLRWKDNILIPLDPNLRIKIVDFGNGCWTHKHFTNNIQTREYRSPEVILGLEYKSNTDIWSLACMIFEMLTNTFLFKPRKGENYEKNDDHLALMIETLGPIPKHMIANGKYSRNYFDKQGELLKIHNIKDYSLKEILHNEFKYDKTVAADIEAFLLPMLEYDPKKRIDAKTAFKSPWLWS